MEFLDHFSRLITSATSHFPKNEGSFYYLLTENKSTLKPGSNKVTKEQFFYLME